MQHICDKCECNQVDIMSCEQKDNNIVVITYICPICGHMRTETYYLYSKQKLKKYNKI